MQVSEIRLILSQGNKVYSQVERSVKTVVPDPNTVSPVKTPFSPSHMTNEIESAVCPGVLRHRTETLAISGTSFHFGLPSLSCFSRCLYVGSIIEIINPGMTGWNGWKGENGVYVPFGRLASSAASVVGRFLGEFANSTSSGEGNFQILGGGRPNF